MNGPAVVVVGAGVVGASLAEELSARGWDRVTVVEQGGLPAPGGSSSHAPGLVFQTNGSKAMAELARYTVQKLVGLDLDGEPCFLQVGGLEVATTPERLAELHRRCGWATSWGIEARVVSPAECLELYPMLEPEKVLGGLLVPTDGVAKAVRAVHAQLRTAQQRGVRVLDNTEVLDVLTEPGDDGRPVVRAVQTSAGDLEADIVVCCAGIWGPKVAGMVGMTLPLIPLAHQLAWTTPVASMAERAQAAGGSECTRPIIRHQDADLYYRDRYDQVGIGYYGHAPMPVTADSILPVAEAPVMPSVLSFTPVDFEPAWAESQVLLPDLAQTELTDGINGLFSFTTDDMPLLGPSPAVDGFWVAEAVWVTHSAGVGRAMAEWLVDGHCSSFDLHECDVNRFELHQLAPDYVLERSSQNFVEVYDIKHPLEPMVKPRPMRRSPFHVRQVELGAHMLEAAGWERPQWYAANAGLLEGRSVPSPDAWAGQHWSPIAAAEAQITRERVAMYDMSALTHLEVTGPGATDFLQRVTTGDVSKSVGSVTYCLLLDDAGGIRSDVTVARLGPDRYQVGANGALDLDRLLRQASQFSRSNQFDGFVEVRNVTAGTCCIGLWGPLARDVLQPLTSSDLSNAALKYFRGTELYVGTVPVTALRLSYVGELGWELYTTADQGLTLWDTIWKAGRQHGLIAAGRAAFNGLRLEKGYRSFGTDMTFEHDPWEAGVGFAVRMAKEDFVGRAAVEKRKDDVGRRLSCLTVSGDEFGGDGIVLGKEPVFSGDSCVGYVTSASYGYTIGTGIAYAWLPAELSEQGTELTIGWFDRRLPATVAAEPLFDPEMKRIRVSERTDAEVSDVVRVAMWSGPRNISTAMMRSFGARADSVVVDEPLYAHYLARTGLDHPGRDAILASQPTDWREAAATLLDPLPPGISVQYVKHMTHHLLPEIGRDWLAGFRHAYLIRDPAAVVASYAKVREAPTLADLGFEQQVEIFRRFGGPVIDAQDVLRNPHRVLGSLCDELGIGFDQAMLSWAPGPRSTDGVWARFWYAGVEASTGFVAPRTGLAVAPAGLAELVDAARPLYQELAAHRL